MSASLHFPKYISDIIIAKGIAHLEPEWNFSVSNGKFSLSLVWSHVPTEHLILSPPPIPATRCPSYGFSNNMSSTNTNNSPVRNYSNIPPRFLNKRYKGRNEKPVGTSVLPNVYDQSLPVHMGYASRGNVNENDLESNKSPAMESSIDSNIFKTASLTSHDKNSETVSSIPVELKREIVNDTCKDDDSSIVNCGNYEHSASADIDHGDFESEIVSLDYNIESLSHGDIEHSVSFYSHDDYIPSPLDNSDSQSILSESEIQDETHPCTNIFTTARVSHFSGISKCPTEPNDENCVSISSDNILNTISLVAANPAITDFIDSTNEFGNENEVDHVSDIIDDVDSGCLSEPPCISERDQSVEQLSTWVDSMMSYLHGHGRFNTVMNATWSRSAKVQYRGLTDDPLSGHSALRRSLDLDGMFHAISQGCPLSKSYLSRQSTSLKDVWSLVYTHYGHKYSSD